MKGEEWTKENRKRRKKRRKRIETCKKRSGYRGRGGVEIKKICYL